MSPDSARSAPLEPLVIGIDPDTQGTGVALCSPTKVLAVAVCSTLNGRKGIAAVRNQIEELRRVIVALCTSAPVTACVSEMPQDYGEYRRKVDPNNLMLLSVIAGAGVGIAGSFLGQENCFTVAPSMWKGQRPKAADHKITMNHYGWEYNDQIEPVIPEDVAQMTPIPNRHEKEILDAMGIARWYALKSQRRVV